MAERTVRAARGFAPCHATGVVVPSVAARDPRARGSLGAGVVLELGVRSYAELRPSSAPSVHVVDDAGRRLPISEEVARRLLGPRRARITVALTHDLPVGQGFGTSAAGALATGLVVARLLGLRRSEATMTAHLADLFGGGGLGGVAAILGGGLEIRVRPGVPPWGRVVRVPCPGPLVVGTTGAPMPSRSILADRPTIRRLERCQDIFEALRANPDSETFWTAAEAFTGRAGLCPPSLATTLRALRRRGARAAQAMFGSSFFARPPRGRRGPEFARWLSARPIPVRWTGVADVRARPGRERPPPGPLASPTVGVRGRTQAF